MKITANWFSARKTLAAVMGTAVLLVGIPATSVSASGDDYPYRGRPNLVDPYGFYTGYCTSFAAWRLAQHGIVFHGGSLRGPNGRTARFGNAGNWDTAARAIGFVVDSHPSVGAVAVWHGGEDGAWWGGHVAFVMALSGASAVVEEYNWSHYLRYGTRVVQAKRYIHFLPGGAPLPQPQPPSQPVAAVVPAATQTYRTTDVLRMRARPTTLAPTVGFLPKRAQIKIVCQTRSSSVINGDPIWDRLSNGTYVSDYYTTTPAIRTFSPGLARC